MMLFGLIFCGCLAAAAFTVAPTVPTETQTGVRTQSAMYGAGVIAVIIAFLILLSMIKGGGGGNGFQPQRGWNPLGDILKIK